MERLKQRSTRFAVAVVAVLVVGLAAYGCGGSSSRSGFAGSPPGSFDTATFDNAAFQ